jgi:hypothetical protein
MVSDPGDYIGQGQPWSYATDAGDGISTGTNGSHVSIAVNAYNGDWWYLDFDAPGRSRWRRAPTRTPPGIRSTGPGPGSRSTATAAAATS